MSTNQASMRGEMKIEENGFTVTEVCEQIPHILVSATGLVRFSQRTQQGGLATSLEMTADDFAKLHAAMDVVRGRLDARATAEQIRKAEPRIILDGANDLWERREDHNGRYVIRANNHRAECGRTGDCGETREWIEENYRIKFEE